MGASYYEPVTQWSRGEYTGATNTEDDTAVMQTHGAALLPDDFGNTLATAASLTGKDVSLAGRIGTQTDTDWFTFTTSTGGPLSLSVTPSPVSPDLDAALTLRDSAGTVITTDSPPSAYVSADQATGMGASINTDILAGTYSVEVDGVGSGDPLTTGYSDYASVGTYTLTGTLPTTGTPNQPPVAKATATPQTGAAPLNVTFSDAGTSDPDGTIVSTSWQWGDGTTSGTGDSPSHTYANPGGYTVTLTVTDNRGATGIANLTVTVTGGSLPAAPSSVTASARSRTVTVNWKDNATNETGYSVVRESQGRGASWGNPTTVASSLKANTPCITDSVGRGTYRYTVKAFNANGSSLGAFSNVISV
jgi:PKD repeat protein